MRVFSSLTTMLILIVSVAPLGLSGCQQQPSEVNVRDAKDVPPPSERGGGAFAGKPVKIPD